MDGDGDVDAVVIANADAPDDPNGVGRIMVWDLQTTDIIAGPFAFNRPGGSRATINNFDNDPEPEIAFTANSNIFAFDDIVNSNGGAGGLNNYGMIPQMTLSGHTQVTSFDFDGRWWFTRFAYRDNDNFRDFLLDQVMVIGNSDSSY